MNYKLRFNVLYILTAILSIKSSKLNVTSLYNKIDFFLNLLCEMSINLSNTKTIIYTVGGQCYTFHLTSSINIDELTSLVDYFYNFTISPYVSLVVDDIEYRKNCDWLKIMKEVELALLTKKNTSDYNNAESIISWPLIPFDLMLNICEKVIDLSNLTEDDKYLIYQLIQHKYCSGTVIRKYLPYINDAKITSLILNPEEMELYVEYYKYTGITKDNPILQRTDLSVKFWKKFYEWHYELQDVLIERNHEEAIHLSKEEIRKKLDECKKEYRPCTFTIYQEKNLTEDLIFEYIDLLISNDDYQDYLHKKLTPELLERIFERYPFDSQSTNIMVISQFYIYVWRFCQMTEELALKYAESINWVLLQFNPHLSADFILRNKKYFPDKVKTYVCISSTWEEIQKDNADLVAQPNQYFISYCCYNKNVPLSYLWQYRDEPIYSTNHWDKTKNFYDIIFRHRDDYTLEMVDEWISHCSKVYNYYQKGITDVVIPNNETNIYELGGKLVKNWTSLLSKNVLPIDELLKRLYNFIMTIDTTRFFSSRDLTKFQGIYESAAWSPGQLMNLYEIKSLDFDVKTYNNGDLSNVLLDLMVDFDLINNLKRYTEWHYKLNILSEFVDVGSQNLLKLYLM